MKKQYLIIGAIVLLLLFYSSKKTDIPVPPGYCVQQEPFDDWECGVDTGYYEEPRALGRNAMLQEYHGGGYGVDYLHYYGLPPNALYAKLNFFTQVGGLYEETVADIPESCMTYDPDFINFKINIGNNGMGGGDQYAWIKFYCETAPDTWHFLNLRDWSGAGANLILLDDDMLWYLYEASYAEFIMTKNNYLAGGDTFQQFIDNAYYWVAT